MQPAKKPGGGQKAAGHHQLNADQQPEFVSAASVLGPAPAGQLSRISKS
jgi:hypothetical protein